MSIVKTASELIETLQDIVARHGDLPIWVHRSWLGYDDTEREKAPLVNAPMVAQSGDRVVLVINSD